MINIELGSLSGFVEQFGTIISATGVKTLDANYVGLWGAISYVTQAMAQFTSPFTANRFGLRFNMWFFTIMKLVVSVISTSYFKLRMLF